MPKCFRVIPTLFLFLASASPLFAQTASGLTATVNNTTVTLNWSGTGGSFVVEASLVPGGLAIATLPVNGTTLTVPNVPSGNYYVRVRAQGGSVSNEILVSVFGGCPAPPSPPLVTVRSVGLQASVAWSSGGGCAPTSYTLFAGSAPGLSNIVVVNAGAQPALNTIAPPGIYYVRVMGTSAWGSAMSEEYIVRVALNAQTDTVPSGGAVAFDVFATQAGAYQAQLVWNDATIDLDLYMASTGCPYPPTGCLLAISDSPVGNTETVSKNVGPGEGVRLWVDNFSPRRTSFTIYNTISGQPLPTTDARDEAPAIRKVKP